MTKVVRGAGRARAAANARHAQRTPLPPRTERQRTPADVAANDAERRKAALAPKNVARVKYGVIAISKAGAFAKDAEAAGWAVERILRDGVKTVVATRGAETISISWNTDRFVDDATHVIDGMVRRLRNASDARKVLVSEPGSAPRPAPRSQRSDATNGVIRLKKAKALPFHPADSSDEEVLAAFAPGSRVVWWNSLSENEQEDRIYCYPAKDDHQRKDPSRPLRTLTVETVGARRVVTFPTEESGIRSVYLDAVVSLD